MELVIMYLVAIAAVGIVGFMLVKKMDIKISLFLIGIVLMYIALLMGKDISFTDFVSSGVTWLDPFKVVGDQFVSTLTSAGFIILILGGYTGYMSHIGANEVTVSVLAKPIAHIKSRIYSCRLPSCWATCCLWSFRVLPTWLSSLWQRCTRCFAKLV